MTEMAWIREIDLADAQEAFGRRIMGAGRPLGVEIGHVLPSCGPCCPQGRLDAKTNPRPNTPDSDAT